MRYRRNSDEEVRNLERDYLASMSEDNYQRYLRICERNGIQNPLCRCGRGATEVECLECFKRYCRNCAPICRGQVPVPAAIAREMPDGLSTMPCGTLLCCLPTCSLCGTVNCSHPECTQTNIAEIGECDNCNKDFCNSTDCSVTCNACGSQGCKKCSLKCSSCEETYCSGCSEECSSCSEKACPNEDCSCYAECHFCSGCRDAQLEECTICNSRACGEHSSECQECSEKVCEECATKCSRGCETTFCENCKKEYVCSDCGDVYCTDCRNDDDVVCSQCEQFYCVGCAENGGMLECSECEEVLDICSSCQEEETNLREECSACKKIVCQKCSKKHLERHLQAHLPVTLPGVTLKVGDRVTHPSSLVPGTVLKISVKQEVVKAVIEWDDENAGMHPVSELKVITKRRRYYS